MSKKIRNLPSIRINSIRSHTQSGCNMFFDISYDDVFFQKQIMRIRRSFALNTKMVAKKMIESGYKLQSLNSIAAILDIKLKIADKYSPIEEVCATGWFGHTFVSPDKTFDLNKSMLKFCGHETAISNFSSKKSLEDWKNGIRVICDGDPLAILLIAAALAAPLMRFAGLKGGFVCALAEGAPGEAAELLSVIESAGVVRARCLGDGTASRAEIADMPCMPLNLGFCLDHAEKKVQQASKQSAPEFVAVEGTAQSIFDRSTSSRGAIVFSRANETVLDSKGGLGDTFIALPMQVYSLGLWCDGGTEHDEGRLRTAHDAARANGGVALGRFISQTVHRQDELVNLVPELMREFDASSKEAGQKTQKTRKRAVEFFALVNAAGRLAARWGIVPWTETECNTVCLDALGVYDYEPPEPKLGRIAEMILMASKNEKNFPWLNKGQSIDPDQADMVWGVRRNRNQKHPILAVSPNKLAKITDLNEDSLPKILRAFGEMGALKLAADGQFARQERIEGYPSGARPRMYVFLLKQLEVIVRERTSTQSGRQGVQTEDVDLSRRAFSVSGTYRCGGESVRRLLAARRKASSAGANRRRSRSELIASALKRALGTK